MAMTDAEKLDVAFAQAGFAAAAVARLVDALHRAGVVDELLLGEIQGMTYPAPSEPKGDYVERRMGAMRAKLTGDE